MDYRDALTRQVLTDDKSSAHVTSQGEQVDYRDALTRQVETKDCSSAHVVMQGDQLDFRYVLKRDDVTVEADVTDDDAASHDVTQSSIDFENFGQEQTNVRRVTSSHDTASLTSPTLKIESRKLRSTVYNH